MAAGDQDTRDRAEQDREKGAGLDKRIAEDEVRRRQKIWQDRIFERTEERRGHTHHREERQQHKAASGENARRGGQHHRDLAKLDQPDQPGLVVLIGDLPGGRRAQKERQDEKPAGERDQDLRRKRRGCVGAIGDHQHQRVLQRIVVERR